jgi:hypothetical protein
MSKYVFCYTHTKECTRTANVSANEDTVACCDLLRSLRKPSRFIVRLAERIRRELVLCAD